MSPSQSRPILSLIEAVRTLEGGGFPVRRPFPTAELSFFDPFLLLDHLGPVEWGPGEAIGAPDHPHRGFETVSYVLAGRKEHRDSAGHSGRLGPGDVQWMTAGAGVVHSEMPEAEFHRTGGLQHGFQIWVNLPRKDKLMRPRYQDIPAARIPEAESADGKVRVRVIAGEALGVSAVIDTVIPITYLHFVVQPGGTLSQPIPAAQNALAYVFAGAVRLGPEGTPVGEGHMAAFGAGDAIEISQPADAAGPGELLLLAGTPLNEPVARWGPFVMNTREEIIQAARDYEEGRMGQIAPTVGA